MKNKSKKLNKSLIENSLKSDEKRRWKNNDATKNGILILNRNNEQYKSIEMSHTCTDTKYGCELFASINFGAIFIR